MSQRELTCIVCPRGCHLIIGDDMRVTGNFCPRGVRYAQNELKNPLRMLTTTVKIDSTLIRRLPVMSSKELPKALIIKAMEELSKINVTAPIKCGDIIVKNIAGSDVDIKATRSVMK